MEQVATAIVSLEHEAAEAVLGVHTACTQLDVMRETQCLRYRMSHQENITEEPQNDINDAYYTQLRNKPRPEVEHEAIQHAMRALSIFLDPAECRRRTTPPESSSHYYEALETDEFNYRPLPYIIGTPEFKISTFGGLGD